MSGKVTASGGAGVGPNRRKWDMDEYGEKARQRDREEKERAQENEERIRKGQKPLQRRRQEILPKATETLQAREKDLEIEKNQGKTLMVEGDQQGASVGGGGKRGGPGFHCQACNRTFKDSLAYLDHVNGRLHLRKLGQTTQVARSTLQQVRARLEYWQEEKKQRSKTETRQYDFKARMEEIAAQQKEEKQQRRLKRREAKESRVKQVKMDDAEAMSMMGFGSFGSSKK